MSGHQVQMIEKCPLDLTAQHSLVTLARAIGLAVPQHPWKVSKKIWRSVCPSYPRKCFPFQILYFLTITVLFLCYRSDWMSQEINLLACDWNGHHPWSALSFSWRSHISCEESSPGLPRDLTNNFPYCSDIPDGPWPVSTVLSYPFSPTW